MTEYQYTKASVDTEMLTIEINTNQNISQDVSYTRWKAPNVLKIYFENPLTTGEETELTTIVTNHTPSSIGEKNFLKTEYNSNGEIIKETWYNTDEGEGVYSGKVEETTYSYSSPHVITSHTAKTFWINETERSSETYDYYTDGDGNLILKKVE